MKNQAQLYSTNVSLNTISALKEMIETGKNASVLLSVANNMKENKKLQPWAVQAFGAAHFEQLFSLNLNAFKKVVKSDSYDFLRTVINIHLKKSVISEEQSLKLTKLLTIQTFANNAFLQDILKAYNDSLNPVENEDAALINDEASSVATNQVSTKKSDVFLLGEKIKALGLDDALALRQLLDAHIDALSQENAEKAA